MEKIHERNALDYRHRAHYSKTQTHPASEETKEMKFVGTQSLPGNITNKSYSKWIFGEVHTQRLRTFYKYLQKFSVFLNKSRVEANRPLRLCICLDWRDSPLVEPQLGRSEQAGSDDQQHPLRILSSQSYSA